MTPFREKMILALSESMDSWSFTSWLGGPPPPGRSGEGSGEESGEESGEGSGEGSGEESQKSYIYIYI